MEELVVNLEFPLRVAVFLGIAVLFSILYYRFGIKALRRFRFAHKPLIVGVISCLLGISTLFAIFFIYVYHGFGYQPDIYRTGNRGSNKVAITFDDGPSEEFTLPILDILRDYDVPATFFMV